MKWLPTATVAFLMLPLPAWGGVRSHATDCSNAGLACTAGQDTEMCFEVNSQTFWICNGATTNFIPIGGVGFVRVGVYHVTDYGALCDNAADDTTEIQAAIDAAILTGGIVQFPAGICLISAPLVMDNSVTLQGVGTTRLDASALATQIKVNGSWSGTAMITDQGPGSIERGMAVRHLDLRGSNTVTNGILWDDDEWSIIEDVFVSNFEGACIYLKATTGNVGTVRDSVLQNCVGATGLSGRIGALTVEWSDCFINNVVAGTNTGDYSEGGNRVGILFAGAAGFMGDSVGQLSEDGIVVTGNRNRLTGVRADLNRGHGFVIEGGVNQITGALANSNSQETDNTYDGFSVSGQRNLFTGCYAEAITANDHRYGFRDTLANSVAKNRYVNNVSFGHATAAWSTDDFSGAVVDFGSNAPILITDEDATPSVAQHLFWKTGNTIATTITAFDDGISGQRIVIRIGDANTTIDFSGTTLKGNGGVDWVPVSNNTMSCISDGTNWYCDITGALVTHLTEDEVEAFIFDADAENVTGVWEWQNNIAATFGDSANATILYNGTNLLINPQASGTGFTDFTDAIFVAENEDVFSRVGLTPSQVSPAPTDLTDMFVVRKSREGSDSANVKRAIMAILDWNSTSAQNDVNLAFNGFVYSAAAQSTNNTKAGPTPGGLVAGRWAVRHYGAGTIARAGGLSGTVRLQGDDDGTITEGYGFLSHAPDAGTVASGGGITEYFGLWVWDSLGDQDRVGTMYGVEIEDLDNAAASYGMHIAGARTKGIWIQDSSSTAADTRYGIHIEDLTNATGASYGLVLDGADDIALWLSNDSGTANDGIRFGTTDPVTLYKSAANILTTDDQHTFRKSVVSLASGTLTLNTVTLATAGATDFDVPDLSCNDAADIGNWFTIVVEDASTVIEIQPLDASNILIVEGLAQSAGEELDSCASGTENEGCSITMTCLAAEQWYSTARVGTWQVGGAPN